MGWGGGEQRFSFSKKNPFLSYDSHLRKGFVYFINRLFYLLYFLTGFYFVFKENSVPIDLKCKINK